jgi:hypothetical protein
MLSIVSPTTLPFQKICGNCHVANVIIFPTSSVYCNACRSKSTIQKLSFLCGSIATNDEHMLLIIKGKWLEAIVHVIKSEFLDLPCPKQVQFLNSIHIDGKFCLLSTYALASFQEDIQQFIPQAKTSLKGEVFIAPSTIIPNDNV